MLNTQNLEIMELDRHKFLIERFDHYYDSINNKCSVFLTLNTFIVGGLIAAYPTLIDKVNCGIGFHIVMGLLLAIGLTILLLVTWTLTPYLGTPANSILFFGDIARIDHATFSDLSKLATEEIQLADFRKQVHILSIGLIKKYGRLRIVGKLMIAQFILIVPLVLLIVINLK